MPKKKKSLPPTTPNISKALELIETLKQTVSFIHNGFNEYKVIYDHYQKDLFLPKTNMNLMAFFQIVDFRIGNINEKAIVGEKVSETEIQTLKLLHFMLSQVLPNTTEENNEIFRHHYLFAFWKKLSSQLATASKEINQTTDPDRKLFLSYYLLRLIESFNLYENEITLIVHKILDKTTNYHLSEGALNYFESKKLFLLHSFLLNEYYMIVRYHENLDIDNTNIHIQQYFQKLKFINSYPKIDDTRGRIEGSISTITSHLYAIQQEIDLRQEKLKATLEQLPKFQSDYLSHLIDYLNFLDKQPRSEIVASYLYFSNLKRQLEKITPDNASYPLETLTKDFFPRLVINVEKKEEENDKKISERYVKYFAQACKVSTRLSRPFGTTKAFEPIAEVFQKLSQALYNNVNKINSKTFSKEDLTMLENFTLLKNSLSSHNQYHQLLLNMAKQYSPLDSTSESQYIILFHTYESIIKNQNMAVAIIHDCINEKDEIPVEKLNLIYFILHYVLPEHEMLKIKFENLLLNKLTVLFFIIKDSGEQLEHELYDYYKLCFPELRVIPNSPFDEDLGEFLCDVIEAYHVSGNIEKTSIALRDLEKLIQNALIANPNALPDIREKFNTHKDKHLETINFSDELKTFLETYFVPQTIRFIIDQCIEVTSVNLEGAKTLSEKTKLRLKKITANKDINAENYHSFFHSISDLKRATYNKKSLTQLINNFQEHYEFVASLINSKYTSKVFQGCANEILSVSVFCKDIIYSKSLNGTLPSSLNELTQSPDYISAFMMFYELQKFFSRISTYSVTPDTLEDSKKVDFMAKNEALRALNNLLIKAIQKENFKNGLVELRLSDKAQWSLINSGLLLFKKQPSLSQNELHSITLLSKLIKSYLEKHPNSWMRTYLLNEITVCQDLIPSITYSIPSLTRATPMPPNIKYKEYSYANFYNELIQSCHYEDTSRVSYKTLFNSWKDTLFCEEHRKNYFHDFISKSRKLLKDSQEASFNNPPIEISKDKLSLLSFILIEVLPGMGEEVESLLYPEFLLFAYKQLFSDVKLSLEFTSSLNLTKLEKCNYLNDLKILKHYLGIFNPKIEQILKHFSPLKSNLAISKRTKLFYKQELPYLQSMYLCLNYMIANDDYIKMDFDSGLIHTQKYKAIFNLYEKDWTLNNKSNELIHSYFTMNNELERLSIIAKEQQDRIISLNLSLDDYKLDMHLAMMNLLHFFILNPSRRMHFLEALKVIQFGLKYHHINYVDPIFILYQNHTPELIYLDNEDDLDYALLPNLNKLLSSSYSFAQLETESNALKTTKKHFEEIIAILMNSPNMKDELTISSKGTLCKLLSQLRYIQHDYKTTILKIESKAESRLSTQDNSAPYLLSEAQHELDYLINLIKELNNISSFDDRLSQTPEDFIPRVFSIINILLSMDLPKQDLKNISTNLRPLLLNFMKYYSGSTVFGCEKYMFNIFLKIEKLWQGYVASVPELASNPLPKPAPIMTPPLPVAETPAQILTPVPVSSPAKPKAINPSWATYEYYHQSIDSHKPSVTKSSEKSSSAAESRLQQGINAKLKPEDKTEGWNFGKETDSILHEFENLFNELHFQDIVKESPESVKKTENPIENQIENVRAQFGALSIESNYVTSRMIPVPDYITSILTVLEDSEHNIWAYVVGGYVRDSLIGMPFDDIHDIDIVCNQKDIIDILTMNGFTCVQSHKRKTLYYVSSETKDFKPVEIELSSAKHLFEDANNRDITINAFYANKSGQVLDPLQALADIKLNYIRLINHAHTRLKDDPSRIFRLIKYSVQCHKQIPNYVSVFMRELAPTLSTLPHGVYKSHLTKMFYHANFHAILHQMQKHGILKNISLCHHLDYLDLFKDFEIEIIESLKALNLEYKKTEIISSNLVFHKIIAILLMPISDLNGLALAEKFYRSFSDFDKSLHSFDIEELADCIHALRYKIPKSTVPYLPSQGQPTATDEPALERSMVKKKPPMKMI